jgi:hypothetical protein
MYTAMVDFLFRYSTYRMICDSLSKLWECPYIHRIGTMSVVVFLLLKILCLITYSWVGMVSSVAPSPSSPHYTAQEEILHML